MAANLDVSELRYLVDVGGGDGTVVQQCKATWRAKGAVMELPTVQE